MVTTEGTVSPPVPNEAIVFSFVNAYLEQRQVPSAQ
jgi:hypothetical protein